VWSYTRQQFSVVVPDPLEQANAGAAAWEYIGYLTGPQRSHILLALAGVGLVTALLLGRGQGRLLALWGLLVGLMATPYGPVFNPFRPDHMAIVLFLPGSLLLAGLWVDCGQGLAALASRIPWKPDLVRQVCAVFLPLCVGLGVSAWGIWETREIVNPVTVLAGPGDVAALRWVQDNTPADARFLINSTQWMTGIYRGVDGGYWLLPITGRFSVVPPAAFGWGSREDIQRIVDWDQRASALKTCDEGFWVLVREARLGYIYLRGGVGSLQPDGLTACPGVEPVYNTAGVSIYRLTP
jgi:hypothetical protein